MGGQQRLDVASLGCLTVFLGIVPVFLLGKLGGWIGAWISPEAVPVGRMGGWVVGIGIFVAALASFIPYERRQRMRGRRDAADPVVQEISVSGPRVFELRLIGDNEPILAFDVGGQKILFLQGQWLREPETYGAPLSDADPEEQFLNGLPAPHSFPSREFTVTRLPHSGRVLGIRVQGEYLPAEREVDALRREFEFADSELFDGTLDDIAGVLARVHERAGVRR